MVDWITPSAALALGAALARANSCTVASTRRLVFEGHADWLVGLAVAMAWAGLTMTLFAVALPQVVLLPAPKAVGWQVIVGAIIIGLGATMNRGCFLGSVAALGRDLGEAGLCSHSGGDCAGRGAAAEQCSHSASWPDK